MTRVSGPQSHIRWYLTLAAVVVAATLFWYTRTTTARALPDFVLEDLMRPRIMLSTADLIGEPAVVNFWASWCVACRDEHSLLARLSADHGVAVHGVNFRDERPNAVRWIGYFGNPYRSTPFDVDGELGRSLGVEALPVSYVIDRSGSIHYRHLGPLDAHTVDAVILPLLDGLKTRR